MARHFQPLSNTVSRCILLSVPLIVLLVAWAAWALENSPNVTSQNVTLSQPVPFSHEHHVGGLGIDCRYCHTTVLTSSFAGMPATKVCISCHSQIWTNAPMLEPVRQSWRDDTPIRWNRVYNVPDYVYFNHQIHVNKGVGCAVCHGRVDKMPLMQQAVSLEMRWCLECHRNPEKYLRPREEVFNLAYDPPKDQPTLGRDLVQRYHVRSEQAMTDCSTCHR